jgi:hypothetical protein
LRKPSGLIALPHLAVSGVLPGTNFRRRRPRYSAVTGVKVTGPSKPQSVRGQCEASNGL